MESSMLRGGAYVAFLWTRLWRLDSSRRLLISSVIVSLLSGCATGFYDGMRVDSRTTPIRMEGYILKPGTSGAEVRVYARNISTGAYDLIATTAQSGSIANRVSYTMNDGTRLYSWNLGSRALGSAYWRSGTNGFYARVRAEWYDEEGERVAQLLNPRADGEDCIKTENRNGQANTLGYISENCFSHRKDAYIYTQGYRQGPSTCPIPAETLAKIHDHYLLENIPACAQAYIRDRIAESINRALIDDHHKVDHVSAPNAYKVDETGGFRLGGFFGGHENYLRIMKRHVMVYDYPWMPRGEIPAWRPNTTIPPRWRTAVASRRGNCDSMDMNCEGWLSGSVANSAPNIPTPSALLPNRVCQYQTSEALFNRASIWHTNVHATVGNSFRTMDSPSFPLFFLWHTHVQDVWLDWKACGNPGP